MTSPDERPLSYYLVPTDVWYGKWTCDVLRCPECGHGYTHLRETVIYQREEDGETLRVTVDAKMGARQQLVPESENPSPRRHAVSLRFEGECGHWFTVTFIQHKGQTFASTEEVAA